jgi:hypothetical protein
MSAQELSNLIEQKKKMVNELQNELNALYEQLGAARLKERYGVDIGDIVHIKSNYEDKKIKIVTASSTSSSIYVAGLNIRKDGSEGAKASANIYNQTTVTKV